MHGGVSQADSDDVHFLFINEGAATLSGSALGGTIIRDAITQREVQLLEHTCIFCPYFSAAFAYDRLATANRHISVMVRSGFGPESRGAYSFPVY